MERAVVVLFLTVCLGGGCSGGGANGDSGYDAARQTYDQSATERARPVAEAVAAGYLGPLSAGSSDAAAVAKAFEDQITNLADLLCDEIRTLADKAGSGDTKRSRLDDIRAATEDIVQDEFRGALLKQALAAPAAERDRLLDALGVRALRPDGTELRGTAALADAGLLDIRDRLVMPERGTDDHMKYERWASTDAPGFAGIESRLSGDARTRIEECTSSA